MKIKMLIMDVDGTLTDGGIYIGNDGEVFKRFSVKDGYAISGLLPRYGIIPVIITGRESTIVKNRCKELGIEILIQGCTNKKEALEKLIAQEKIDLSEIAYIGDDLNDYECMKDCGCRACPKDAVEEIKNIADFISTKAGGYGAVREFVEWLIKKLEISN